MRRDSPAEEGLGEVALGSVALGSVALGSVRRPHASLQQHPLVELLLLLLLLQMLLHTQPLPVVLLRTHNRHTTRALIVPDRLPRLMQWNASLSPSVLLTSFVSALQGGPPSLPGVRELDAALVEDALDEQLEQPVPAGPEARLAQLPVRGDELGHHGAGLFEAMDARRARVPVFELSVGGEARQREQEAQLAVVVLGGTALLQAVEALHRRLHGELQLEGTGGQRGETR
ncbi:hypothetical protein EYF80_053203 [Liparis tanakae]|uniref:Uncharacterized protein n=1 Tax=Liparis tanakae TaxID=230148 RepID=A0A4Z2F6D3_9TELE|nr:hypothetical protein EYF80_053203 [Liparis tanakae]